MHFSSTDLPVPDPPMITMLCPDGMVRFTPLQHAVRAEGLVDVREASIMR